MMLRLPAALRLRVNNSLTRLRKTTRSARKQAPLAIRVIAGKRYFKDRAQQINKLFRAKLIDQRKR